jgi:hypothetical protein
MLNLIQNLSYNLPYRQKEADPVRQLADCQNDGKRSQNDKLGNRHSGLDPESVLMPKADPDFRQDDELVKSRTKIIRGQEAKLRFAIKIWI